MSRIIIPVLTKALHNANQRYQKCSVRLREPFDIRLYTW